MITTFAVTIFSVAGFSAAATDSIISTTTTKTIVGVPIHTFCSTYAKDVATKSVAISLIVKIKDNPAMKASLMRQYSTFIALGKQYCKGQYAPELYGFSHTTMPSVNSSTSIDISQNTPIISSNTGYFSSIEDYFTGYDANELSSLNTQQLDIIHDRISKAKVEYATIVDGLISDGWLQAKDRDEMVGKISFKFSNNCSELDGKILVRERFDQNKDPIKVELISLNITINLCFSYSYASNYQTFIDRIIYHELGHYYNYFYDMDNQSFLAICRSGQTNICQPTEFISTYAPTLPEEDYAETFAYYVQNNQTVGNTKLQQKIDYFKIRDPRYK